MSLTVAFQSKHPHKTRSLPITAPADQGPKDLLDDLTAGG
jgi:hypothetical protein